MLTHLAPLAPQAASMDYQPNGLPQPRVLCYNPFNAKDFLVVPRTVPSWYSFAEEFKSLSETHGLSLNANGRIAFQCMRSQLYDMAVETARVLNMSLAELVAKDIVLTGAVQTDAARRRTRQFLPCVLKNAQLDSQSCFALRLIGLGIRYKDDKNGFRSVLFPNIACIEECLKLRSVSLTQDASAASIRCKINLKFTGDFAGVRAIEGQLCGCPREVIHQTPSIDAVSNFAAVQATCATCDNKTSAEIRALRSHMPFPGETLPRPCDCCSFGHTPRTAAAELSAFSKHLAALEADDSDKGKRALATYIQKHKASHKNSAPGPNGECSQRWVVCPPPCPLAS